MTTGSQLRVIDSMIDSRREVSDRANGHTIFPSKCWTLAEVAKGLRAIESTDSAAYARRVEDLIKAIPDHPGSSDAQEPVVPRPALSLSRAYLNEPPPPVSADEMQRRRMQAWLHVVREVAALVRDRSIAIGSFAASRLDKMDRELLRTRAD